VNYYSKIKHNYLIKKGFKTNEKIYWSILAVNNL